MKVHPTAIVHKGAKLAGDVDVGPYAIIENDTSIGRGTRIGPHCFIGAFTDIGRDNRIFTGAVIGSVSQDLKFKGERSFLKIGDGNIIREYVTMNRSTNKDGSTTVGNDNFLMAYTHIAHDCTIGNSVIIANCGTLAGYVTIEDKVIMGGLAGVHQFVKVGTLTLIGGCSKVVQDLPPYSMADGHPASVRGVNVIGLKRAGFKADKVKIIKRANKILFFSGLTTGHAIKKIKTELSPCPEIDRFVKFAGESKRGLSR